MGLDYYGAGKMAETPINAHSHQDSRQYAASGVVQKEMSVQDRIAHTLHELMGAHTTLDFIEGNVGPDGPPQPQLGLLQGALACEEQASRLAARLQSLRDRLGNL